MMRNEGSIVTNVFSEKHLSDFQNNVCQRVDMEKRNTFKEIWVKSLTQMLKGSTLVMQSGDINIKFLLNSR